MVINIIFVEFSDFLWELGLYSSIGTPLMRLLDVHGDPWMSMDIPAIHAYQWSPMELHGCALVSMDVKGDPLTFLLFMHHSLIATSVYPWMITDNTSHASIHGNLYGNLGTGWIKHTG